MSVADSVRIVLLISWWCQLIGIISLELGSISQRVYELIIEISWKFVFHWFGFLLSSQVTIRLRFCTCQESSALLACAKLWPDVSLFCMLWHASVWNGMGPTGPWMEKKHIFFFWKLSLKSNGFWSIWGVWTSAILNEFLTLTYFF